MKTFFLAKRSGILSLCKLLNTMALVLNCFNVYPDIQRIVILALSLFILMNAIFNFLKLPNGCCEKEDNMADILCYAGILIIVGSSYLDNILLYTLVGAVGVILAGIGIIKQIASLRIQIEKKSV